MKPIAVVTGSAGFIGKHLVAHLEQHGYEVRGFDNRNAYPMNINVNGHIVPKNMQDWCKPKHSDIFASWAEFFAGADFVFHLAALADIVPSIANPEIYMGTNVDGTVRMLEAARKAGVKKFVYAASSSCYGDNPHWETSELARMNPIYPYAMSKYMGELAALHWHKVYRMPVNSLRLFNVYGRGQKTSGAYGSVMGTFLRQKLAGAPLTIVGNGLQQRDFVHVSDVCEAFRLAAETPLSGCVWNIGTGEPKSIRRLAELIGGETINIPDRPGEPAFTCASIHSAKEDLCWHPKMPFEAGIAAMLEHIEEWRDAPLWTPESIAEATKPWMEALS